MNQTEKAETSLRFHVMKIMQLSDNLFTASQERITDEVRLTLRETLTEIERHAIESHVALGKLEGK